MAGWYNKVKDDLANVVDAIVYFDTEFEEACKETSLKGNLERNARDLPGNVSYRFSQLQEIEAILEYLNIETRKLQRKHYRKYLENYNKVLSSRDADKFADGEQDVIDMEQLVNEFALVRNKWLGVMKGMEFKHFQIGNISKLRTAGMEDINLD